MWKKGFNITQIGKKLKVSRPTVRKTIEKFKKNQKWHIVRTYPENDFIRLIVNTSTLVYHNEGTPQERLALGVEHWTANNLIKSLIKPETAEEIISEFMKDPPRISILYVKESEFLSKNHTGY